MFLKILADSIQSLEMGMGVEKRVLVPCDYISRFFYYRCA